MKKFTKFYFFDKFITAIFVATILLSIEYFFNKNSQLYSMQINNVNNLLAKYDKLWESVAEYKAILEELSTSKREQDLQRPLSSKKDKDFDKKTEKIKEESKKAYRIFYSQNISATSLLGNEITSRTAQYVQSMEVYYRIRDSIMFEEMTEEQRKGQIKLYDEFEKLLNDLKLDRNYIKAYFEQKYLR